MSYELRNRPRSLWSLYGSVVRASERGIQRSEVRFLMATQNFFFVPRSWQDGQKNIFLCFFTELKTYHLSYLYLHNIFCLAIHLLRGFFDSANSSSTYVGGHVNNSWLNCSEKLRTSLNPWCSFFPHHLNFLLVHYNFFLVFSELIFLSPFCWR